MSIFLYIALVGLVGAVAYLMCAGYARATVELREREALKKQREKVEELERYVLDLKYSGRTRRLADVSEAREAALKEYLKVAEKKLRQEKEKLEAAEMENDREEFERRMGGRR
jgi:biopolymer transport protein ExbB/TolQ